MPIRLRTLKHWTDRQVMLRRRKQVRRRRARVGRMVLCAACSASLVCGAALLGAASFFKANASPSAAPGLSVADAAAHCDENGFPYIDWEYWQKTNPDVVGWVTVPGTSINLPIVQARMYARTFYLTHDIYKEWNYLGCPYVDAECGEKSLDSQCALVYGHNSDDGSMFADFAQYSDRAFASGHSMVLLQTPDEKRMMQVAAVSVVKGNGASKNALENAPSPGPSVAFCTCSYNYWPDDERTIVYATDVKTDIDATEPAEPAMNPLQSTKGV